MWFLVFYLFFDTLVSEFSRFAQNVLNIFGAKYRHCNSLNFPKYLIQYLNTHIFTCKILLHPEKLPNLQLFSSPAAGWLTRRYFYQSLAERIVTRPFMPNVTKRWCAFRTGRSCKHSHPTNTICAALRQTGNPQLLTHHNPF